MENAALGAALALEGLTSFPTRSREAMVRVHTRSTVSDHCPVLVLCT